MGNSVALPALEPPAAGRAGRGPASPVRQAWLQNADCSASCDTGQVAIL